MNQIKQLIINNVNKILKVKEINYKELAEKMKWDSSNTNKMLNGKRNIGLNNLEKIAKELNLDIQVFLHPNLKVKREFKVTIEGVQSE